MAFCRTTVSIAAAAALFTLLALRPARAQEGVGAAGAQVLQLAAGARAAGMSGAYTAAWTDSDVLFYNPAGVATLDAAASLAYRRYTTQGVTFGSASGAYRIGRISIGAGATFLDAGEIPVIVPDPAFGGERGRETGETASAAESAVRLAGALPLLDGRLRVGAAAGIVSSTLADVDRGTAVFDVGAQYAPLPRITIGASLRNVGGDLSGDRSARSAPLPSEARVGATARLADDLIGFGDRGFGAVLAADVVSRLNEGSTGVVAGVEAGLMPPGTGELGAVARAGYGVGSDGALGALRLGAGVTLGGIAVDYTFQRFEYFGGIHHFGLRWVPDAP